MRKGALKKKQRQLEELLLDRREALGELVLGMYVQNNWDDDLLARGSAEVAEVETELNELIAGKEPEGPSATEKDFPVTGEHRLPDTGADYPATGEYTAEHAVPATGEYTAEHSLPESAEEDYPATGEYTAEHSLPESAEHTAEHEVPAPPEEPKLSRAEKKAAKKEKKERERREKEAARQAEAEAADGAAAEPATTGEPKTEVAETPPGPAPSAPTPSAPPTSATAPAPGAPTPSATAPTPSATAPTPSGTASATSATAPTPAADTPAKPPAGADPAAAPAPVPDVGESAEEEAGKQPIEVPPPPPAPEREPTDPLDILEKQITENEAKAKTAIEAAKATSKADAHTELTAITREVESGRGELDGALAKAAAAIASAEEKASLAEARLLRETAAGREAAAEWVRGQAAEIEADAALAAEMSDEQAATGSGEPDPVLSARVTSLEAELAAEKAAKDEALTKAAARLKEIEESARLAEARVEAAETAATEAQTSARLAAPAEGGNAATEAQAREAAVDWLRGQISALRQEIASGDESDQKPEGK